MRRPLIVPIVLAVTVLTGCTASTGTKRTVTMTNIVTASSTVPSASGSASLTVVGSTTATSPKSSSTPKPSPSPTPTSTKPAPFVKLDPLQASCPSLLSSSDIKKAIGATVGTNNNRVRLGAADNGQTGAIRCLYGSTDAGKTAPVSVRLTQFNTAKAAAAQVKRNIDAASDAGDAISTVAINGYPSMLDVSDEGDLYTVYDTWVMAVRVAPRIAPATALTEGMPKLGTLVLTRVVKNS